jgi:hypothetical protein
MAVNEFYRERCKPMRRQRWKTAPPVITKTHKPGKVKANALRGFFDAEVNGKPAIVEYEPDSELRDTEQVPLLEPGGIEAFIRREVLPYTRPMRGSRKTPPRSATKSASSGEDLGADGVERGKRSRGPAG